MAKSNMIKIASRFGKIFIVTQIALTSRLIQGKASRNRTLQTFHTSPGAFSVRGGEEKIKA
jgi:hypothetical protein